MPAQAWRHDQPDIAEVLRDARLEEAALLAAGSNYVYLLRMTHDAAGEGYAVYKPQRGEAPLSDFPDGTLYQREYAAYLMSEALGWGLIPPTIVREDLDAGVGMLQLFIEHDPAQNYFSLKESHDELMRRIALFDWLTNNADRKGGHTLLDYDGRIWCIDQGLTFHVDDKLRTVIWDYQGQAVEAGLVAEIVALGQRLEADAALRAQFEGMLAPAEYSKLLERIALIDRVRIYPAPPAYRPYPWPMV